MKNKKRTLQDIVGHDLYTVDEAIAKLDWETEYKYEKDDERGTGKITCSCGNPTEMQGLFWINYVYCNKCGKNMRDVTGFFRLINSTAGFLIDPESYDEDMNGRVWEINGRIGLERI